jgi:hypothetical protein
MSFRYPSRYQRSIAQAIKKERTVSLRETGQPMKLHKGQPWENLQLVLSYGKSLYFRQRGLITNPKRLNRPLIRDTT